ncbi:MAG: hypothetical protein JWN25_1057 [Verrucomicrobiales bacterium]|nr:hypothetical protein [Verrucomicrobiales bacterium]
MKSKSRGNSFCCFLVVFVFFTLPIFSQPATRQVLQNTPRLQRKFSPGPGLKGTNHFDRDYEQQWARFTTIDDYRLAGKTNVLWDSHVIAAFEAYSQLKMTINTSPFPEDRLLIKDIVAESSAAIQAGCDDPLLKHIYTMFVQTRDPAFSDRKLGEEYMAQAEAIEKTGYSAIRKYYLHNYAAAIPSTSRTNFTPVLNETRRLVIQHLAEALQDPMVPPREAAWVTHQIWNTCRLDTNALVYMEQTLLPVLRKNWGSHGFACLFEGNFYINKAWESRTRYVADKVTPEGWAGLKLNMNVAEKALKKGWELDSTNAAIATAMITVCMGQAYPRPEMEKWFSRAMAANPSNYTAVDHKSQFLEPKWFGTVPELLEFGRECVNSTSWNGRVPLILVDIRETVAGYLEPDQQSKYWDDPKVWEDEQKSFERFFELNSSDIAVRHHYASAAFRSKHFDVFLMEIKKIDKRINYSTFGGRAQFEKMMNYAARNL